MLGGCEVNSFLNPGEPHIRPPDSEPLVVPILDTLASGIEQPDQTYAAATDIQPQDLVPDVADYRVGPNDLINVTIFDLLGEGTGETVKTIRVSETGSISLDFISPVKASGLTEQELQDAIVKAYEDAKLIRQARVSVTVVEARARTFSIQGNVGQPSEYQITRPDFRMLDAMVVAHAPLLSTGVEYAYVIRKLNPGAAAAPSNPSNPSAAPEMPSVPPASPAAPLTPPASEPTSTTPSTGPSDLLTPQSRANTGTGPALMSDNTAISSAEPFKFDDLQAPADTRIIRVPIDSLRQFGQLQYNIVIRPGDMIVVPDPLSGVYYVGGHVQRSGVFSLAGVKVTLKEAWVAAGGPDDFAIPRRTEVIRRIGADKEVFVRVNLLKILDGEQPDIFLKPNDEVYVGTDLLAPFLAAIRNSFRLTYGFGFLYDRNFYTGAGGLGI
jgi:protein involved in polysaccharide export with SLBB domain